MRARAGRVSTHCVAEAEADEKCPLPKELHPAPESAACN